MKRLRRKKFALRTGSAACNLGGTWMMLVTICQIAQSAERGTVPGFVIGMLAALAYGLCALLLWSYSMSLAAAARRMTKRIARAQALQTYRKLQRLEPGEMQVIEWEKCG